MVEISKAFETLTWAMGDNEVVALLFIGLCAALLVQLALQFVTPCLCHFRRKWLDSLLHPKDFPNYLIWPEHVEAVWAWLAGIVPRRADANGTVKSPTRTYEIISSLGAGDLCDVRYAHSEGRSYVLKYPRIRGCDHLLEKERLILCDLHEQCRGEVYSEYFPLPTESFYFGHRFVSVFESRSGYVTAQAIRERHPRGVDDRHIAWMFNRTLEALGFAHGQGWVHGAVLPSHLLLHPDTHGMQLIGWIHAERLGTPLRLVPRKFRAWYPPECHLRQGATPATDIFLAAKSMIWLAGGDPFTGAMPHSVPDEIQGFLRKCLASSPIDRPQDAWVLHEQFRDLLETVYGPPQFCPLQMA